MLPLRPVHRPGKVIIESTLDDPLCPGCRCYVEVAGMLLIGGCRNANNVPKP